MRKLALTVPKCQGALKPVQKRRKSPQPENYSFTDLLTRAVLVFHQCDQRPEKNNLGERRKELFQLRVSV